MNEHELLPFYLKELSALRELGKGFAQDHPQIASHLQFDPQQIQNPQLAQLLEGLAFMNARVAQQFEQDYPHFISTLTNIIYPHLTAPLPAMAIAQWPASKALERSVTIPRGTLLETDPRQSSSCRFRTGYEVEVHPLQVTQAACIHDGFDLPARSDLRARAALHIRLTTTHPAISLASLNLSQLVFYLQGPHDLPYHLYEALLKDCSAIAIVEQAGDESETHWRSAEQLQGLGFAEEQALLPRDNRTFAGYYWLMEFFALPQKFLFVALSSLPKVKPNCQQLDIYFYLSSKPHAQINQVSAQQFQLGCTPIINLFPKTVEPLTVHGKQAEYPILTDLRQPQDYEIHSIQAIYSLAEQDVLQQYFPLYHPSTKADGYWQARRVAAAQLPGCSYPGTELLLSFAANKPSAETTSLVIETLCTNRQLPKLLMQQTPLPTLQPVYGDIPPLPITWCSSLTAPQPPLLSTHDPFSVLMHLVPNMLSYCRDQGRQLKQMLQLYVQPQQQELLTTIEQIRDLRSQRCAAFVQQANQYGYAQGMDLELQLQERPAGHYSPWLFFNVLERFLGELCPINGFTQLRITTPAEEIYRWPIRSGNCPLI